MVSRAHQLSAGTRGLGHHQTGALLAVSRLLTAAPLGLPRRFFQTLQKTVISVRGGGREEEMEGEGRAWGKWRVREGLEKRVFVVSVRRGDRVCFGNGFGSVDGGS